MTPNEPSHPQLSPEAKKYSTRRDFLLQVGTAINAVAAFMIGVPIIGFVVSSLIRSTPRVWVSLGPVSKFPEGATRLAAYETPYKRMVDGPTATLTCWVRHLEGDKFRIFASNCTHLGCPVRLFEQSQLFLCPCHGGVFYADGQHAAGPPPRGLYEYEYKVENGNLMVKGGVLPTLANPA
jgi:menaquinol-cytochrome c reductase iron-sulfur subunit